MRFRDLYQSDFAAIEPRQELLAAARGLYEQQAKPKPYLSWRRRASALGAAACLLLAVGLCLGLPGNAGDSGNNQTNPALMTRALPEANPEAAMEIALAEQANAQIAAYSNDAEADAPQGRLAAAPQADIADGTDGAEMAKLCGLPLADPDTGLTEYDCLRTQEYIIELPADTALQPLYALELLQPAPGKAAYLIRCGLWLAGYLADYTEVYF